MRRRFFMGLIPFVRFTLVGLLLLSWISCTPSPVTVVVPPSAGTLTGSLSVQVTASEKARLILFNSSDFAELLAPRVQRLLGEHGFFLKGESADQHLVVHVLDAGQGTGTVRSFCKLEVYVYDEYPGKLARARNLGQADDGSINAKKARMHISFDLEDKHRSRAGGESALSDGADEFAKVLVEELVTLRAKTAPTPKPEIRRAPPPQRNEEPQAPPLASALGFEIHRSLAEGPGNLTLTPGGALFISLHQFLDPKYPVAKVDDQGGLTPFAVEAKLDSVLGIQSDENGVVWMLDNGMKSTKKPRLVGWHSVRNKLEADIDLSSVALSDSFFNDLVIDLDHHHAYLADPAKGANAAIVVVDLKTKTARRVLQGQSSVVPEDVDLVIDGTPIEITLPDGSRVRPHVGVNPIAADATNEWLYFGPMHGTSLYRVQTAALRDSRLPKEKLEEQVQRFAEKPITDGISIDRKGNIYLADLSQNAIVRISPDGKSSTVAKDPRLSWVDAFSFGPDGRLFAVANQLHKSPPLNNGRDETKPPFLIIALENDAGGIIGR